MEMNFPNILASTVVETSTSFASCPPASHKVLGIAAALGSAASWALGAILFKRIGEAMSPFAMTLAKGFVSVLMLGLAVLVLGYAPTQGHALWLLVLSGVIGIALGDSFFFKALQDLGPVSMIVLMMVGQIATALLGIVVLREMPAPLGWMGMAFVLGGVVLVLSADASGAPSATRLRGMLWGLASVLCFSVSLIIAKKPLEEVPSIQATFVRMSAGTLGVFLVGLSLGQVRGWVAPLKKFSFMAKFLLAVGVVAFGGFWLSLLSIKYLQVAVASALNATEPIFAIPLAAIVLKDRITLKSFLGSLIVILGVSMIFFSERSA